MDLNKMHTTSERNVKDWLRSQADTHGTDVPKFEQFNGTDYEKVLKDLAVEVYTYVEDKRKYSQTIKIAW